MPADVLDSLPSDCTQLNWSRAREGKSKQEIKHASRRLWRKDPHGKGNVPKGNCSLLASPLLLRSNISASLVAWNRLLGVKHPLRFSWILMHLQHSAGKDLLACVVTLRKWVKPAKLIRVPVIVCGHCCKVWLQPRFCLESLSFPEVILYSDVPAGLEHLDHLHWGLHPNAFCHTVQFRRTGWRVFSAAVLLGISEVQQMFYYPALGWWQQLSRRPQVFLFETIVCCHHNCC